MKRLPHATLIDLLHQNKKKWVLHLKCFHRNTWMKCFLEGASVYSNGRIRSQQTHKLLKCATNVGNINIEKNSCWNLRCLSYNNRKNNIES